MAITIICDCGKTLRAPDTFLGETAKCPACGRHVVIREPGTDECSAADTTQHVFSPKIEPEERLRPPAPATSSPEPEQDPLRLLEDTAQRVVFDDIQARRLQQVVVRDIDMPFNSMVKFMVKWAIATIPAAIILALIFVGLAVLFSFVFRIAIPM